MDDERARLQYRLDRLDRDISRHEDALDELHAQRMEIEAKLWPEGQ